MGCIKFINKVFLIMVYVVRVSISADFFLLVPGVTKFINSMYIRRVYVAVGFMSFGIMSFGTMSVYLMNSSYYSKPSKAK